MLVLLDLFIGLALVFREEMEEEEEDDERFDFGPSC